MYEATIQRGPVIDELLRPRPPAARIELAPGQVVHEPSDAAGVFYVIESGEIRMYDAAADRTLGCWTSWGPTSGSDRRRWRRCRCTWIAPWR